MIKKLFCGVAVLGIALLGQGNAAIIFAGDQSWSATGTEPDQTGRLLRNGIQSTWAAPKANPGLFDNQLQDHQVLTLNSGTYTHIQVSFTMITSHNLYSAAYSSFNPADPAANYLADAGVSTGIPPTQRVFQFIITPSTNFDINLSSIGGVGDLANGTSSLLVEGFLIPEPGSTALVGVAGLLLAGSRRRRTG